MEHSNLNVLEGLGGDIYFGNWCIFTEKELIYQGKWLKPQIVSGAEIIAYIVATLNPEILKKFPGPVRVGKKESGPGRVAGTRQGLLMIIISSYYDPYLGGSRSGLACSRVGTAW